MCSQHHQSWLDGDSGVQDAARCQSDTTLLTLPWNGKVWGLNFRPVTFSRAGRQRFSSEGRYGGAAKIRF